MSDKPENFVITPRSGEHVIERYFELPNGDFISYKRTIGAIKDKPDPTITDLHRASADLVVRYLLRLLPEGYGSQSPYMPGPKKEGQ